MKKLYTIGKRGVEAEFDESTGTVTFHSNHGTLLRNWTTCMSLTRREVRAIKIIGEINLPENASGLSGSHYSLFGGLPNLEDLDTEHINTSNVTNMAYMFDGCKKLKRLNRDNKRQTE